jgi:hypothetical protein
VTCALSFCSPGNSAATVRSLASLFDAQVYQRNRMFQKMFCNYFDNVKYCHCERPQGAKQSHLSTEIASSLRASQ